MSGIKSSPVALAEKKQQTISSFFSQSSDANNASQKESLKRHPSTNVPASTDSAAKRQKTLPVNSHNSPASPERFVRKASVPQQDAALSSRTAKYLFDSSQIVPNGNEDDEEFAEEKARMHRRFVKKLGKPDSIAEIKRRNHYIEDPTGEAEDGADEEDQDEDVQQKAGPKAKKGGARRNVLTPMEKQVLEIKRSHADTVLVVEVGYKFRFFGEDARTAAKELGIMCIPGKMRYDEHPSEAHLDRFASASVPVHRLHVHVKRLVAAGHKVGVVRQIETAALKAAGDNRNTPFIRKLTNLYTRATYIDDVEGVNEAPADTDSTSVATGYLICLTDSLAKGWGNDEKVQVGLVAVQPATGDVIWDDFEDGFMRTELETRLMHLAPCEMVLIGELSKASDKLVRHFAGSRTSVFGDKIRLETVAKPKTAAAEAHEKVQTFYKTTSDSNAVSSSVAAKVQNLPESVVVCLSAMITHLSDYGLETVFSLTQNFSSFSARSHMLLNGTTLNSLEIYRNQTDYTERGSLYSVLNCTSTRFGSRLLRKWIGRPLLDRTRLEQRLDAVEELMKGQQTIGVDRINHVLLKVKGDLEKVLTRIYYGKCSRPELLAFLQTLQLIATEFAHVKSSAEAGFQSTSLCEALVVLPGVLDDVVGILEKIDPEAARSDDKYSFLREEYETESISEHRLGIAAVESDLEAHRSVAADKIRKKKVEYVTVASIPYLIEVDNTYAKNVPVSTFRDFDSETKRLTSAVCRHRGSKSPAQRR